MRKAESSTTREEAVDIIICATTSGLLHAANTFQQNIRSSNHSQSENARELHLLHSARHYMTIFKAYEEINYVLSTGDDPRASKVHSKLFLVLYIVLKYVCM